MQLKIEDSSRKLRSGDLGIPANPDDRLDSKMFGKLSQALPPRPAARTAKNSIPNYPLQFVECLQEVEYVGSFCHG